MNSTALMASAGLSIYSLQLKLEFFIRNPALGGSGMLSNVLNTIAPVLLNFGFILLDRCL